MADPARHLRVLDDEGQVHDRCPECSAKEGELTELGRKMKGMARELAELRKDKEAEARDHRAWPIIHALFRYWQQATGHTGVTWTSDHFWCALHRWKAWGTGNLAAGIAGIAHDPNTKVTKNGRIERYDDWETLMRNDGNVRRYINRRPRDWTLPDSLQAIVDAEAEKKGRKRRGVVP